MLDFSTGGSDRGTNEFFVAVMESETGVCREGFAGSERLPHLFEEPDFMAKEHLQRFHRKALLSDILYTGFRYIITGVLADGIPSFR